MAKKTAAIVGSGNIGSDLMFKIMRRSTNVEVKYMIGVDPNSDGLARAKRLGITTSAEGVDWLLAQDELPDFVFECTSAKAHEANAPKYKAAGIHAIDLTPAAVGPYLAPVVNLETLTDTMNVNMITCAGQATTPIVAAVSSVVPVEYAEIVASIASKSAGPGTRANVDEFTETTAKALEVVGGAKRGKAIIIINPVEPPMMMRNTIYCMIPAEAAAPGATQDAIRAAIDEAAASIRDYVPGYELRLEPQFDEAREDWGGFGRVGIWVQVAGAADYLPEYAGNLDIITAAATRTADLLSDKIDAARTNALAN
ncbi:acetaldehyde dehydrogenase (acetylating) [Paeniglutamicibacter sp. ABSL32-1]|uniref:acetaldehyde dehydrogenase (acetylating) n=1 Tax=Paeniglutamicibacter quisquiliarum TaxID=2849498 RepID=UPI001C2D5E2B|nr:acetaldehyde dehydrogenase (acetylating) [Paeniglutamicibacter quisquiliarum]MBV1778029.1 acetaldehyde dehydrogenase (acetylating) [Paeniglutamicibacter quisquiliarum]